MLHAPTRRRFLLTTATTGLGVADLANVALGATELPLTPACHDHEAPTLAQTEGPFFKPRSPERADLIEPGIKGRPVELVGYVLNSACKPLAHALLDLWHADDDGNYDTAGFRLRGHQFTDAKGNYRLETIVPGVYPGRTRHIHVRAQAPHGRVLTTQLYFPGEPRNRQDSLFRSDLLMAVRDEAGRKQGRFHFLLDAS